MKLNAQQLRELEEKKVQGELKEIKRQPLFFILENIYDTYNIGGLFRLADALAIEKIYLCGDCEVPPNSRIKKASIGTYKVVPWIYKKTAKEAILELKSGFQNTKHEAQIPKQAQSSNLKNSDLFGVSDLELRNYISVVAVEQDAESVPYTQFDYKLPLALLFGNESYGVLPETLKLVDRIVEIPMWGINKSLNVIVSAAIVSYYAVSQVKKLKG